MKRFNIKFVAMILAAVLATVCLTACKLPKSLTEYNYKTEMPIETEDPSIAETERAMIDEIRGEFISKEIIGDFKYSIYKNGAQLDGFADGKESVSAAIAEKLGEKSVIGIGENAFYNIKTLENVTLPKTLKYIGQSAFIYCDNLKIDSLPDGIEFIGTKAFSYCKQITKLELPDSITYLGGYLFAAAGISEVMVPANITTIPEGMFFDTQLAEINIPKHVESIGVNAFARCNLVESLVIPSNIINISEKAFYYNTGLKTVVIEEGLKELTYGVFGGCKSLEKITLPKSVIHYDISIFTECSQKFTVCGYEDSKAEEFATNKKYNFEIIGKQP